MPQLARALQDHLDAGAERRREAKRFLTTATVIAVLALTAMFSSFVILRRESTSPAARLGSEAMLGVEFAALVALVFLLRARLHRNMQAFEEQYELLGAQNARLRDHEELLAELMRSCPLGIVAMDRNLNVLLWNEAAEQIFGWSAAEVLGKPNPITQGVDAEDSRELRDLVARNGRVVGLRLQRTRRDGTRVDLSISAAPIHDRAGTPAGFMIVTGDLTDRIKLENQLRQAQKMEAVGQLAGGIAHDFNNALTVIMSYSEWLISGNAGRPELLEPLNQIREASERAATLTRQLLAFSRQQVLRPRTINLNEIVSGIDRMLHRVLGENIEVCTQLEPDLDPIHADPSQIEQVLMNLAINARDAMPNGGRLVIETKNVDIDATFPRVTIAEMPTGRYVSIVVSDTGIGMTPDVRERIFDPFFTTKEAGKGTGLGLAMVHGIVEQSGGSIAVYSEVGHGTTFRLYFPRVEGVAQPLSRREVRSLRSGTETILLVEDDANVRKVTSTVLSRAGYTVIEAGDGVEALEIAERRYREVDLVITDVVMPNMGGRDFSHELRDRLIDVPLIFISGYARATLTDVDLDAASTAFLEKPFAAQALLDTVRRMLD
jgi:PAS domain S-box-containing protein